MPRPTGSITCSYRSPFFPSLINQTHYGLQYETLNIATTALERIRELTMGQTFPSSTVVSFFNTTVEQWWNSNGRICQQSRSSQTCVESCERRWQETGNGHVS